MKKYIFILLILLTQNNFASVPPADKARGTFLAFAVGPRVPTFDFSNRTTMGYGFNVEIAYTDNEYLPLFLFGRVGFEQFPGSQELYQTTDYSNLATRFLPISFGVRYYLPPILENIIIILPSIELSANILVFQYLHQFKITSGRSNFVEDGSKLGFTAGVSASMFILEVLATYNYYHKNQYMGIDLKVRLPLYISF
ncbi:MAG: hypothetical protein C0425_06605 [Chlorobiaceae bacterium]|nr:hypothetical protein [Chlorobiaceae bacterium]MBA4309991.1 hypothetical protein [Chlorobiaceae bacterium]